MHFDTGGRGTFAADMSDFSLATEWEDLPHVDDPTDLLEDLLTGEDDDPFTYTSDDEQFMDYLVLLYFWPVQFMSEYLTVNALTVDNVLYQRACSLIKQSVFIIRTGFAEIDLHQSYIMLKKSVHKTNWPCVRCFLVLCCVVIFICDRCIKICF